MRDEHNRRLGNNTKRKKQKNKKIAGSIQEKEYKKNIL